MTNEYPLDGILEPMKPCKINKENPNQVRTLNTIMKGNDYVAEEKLDGCHYMMIRGRFFSTQISALTGTPVEKTENFPHLTKEIGNLADTSLILDGEICLVGKRSQDVTRITGSAPDVAVAKQEDTGWVQFRVFDILRAVSGEWMVNTPWWRRRELLEKMFQLTTLKGSQHMVLNPVIETNKEQFLRDTIASGAEGIVLKKKSGLYVCGQRPMWNWIKLKQEDEDDAVIMDYEPPSKMYTGKDVESWPYWDEEDDGPFPVSKNYYRGWIGALVLGKYNSSGELVKVCSCSGMDDEWRRRFSEHGDDYLGKVVKVKMMERTNDGNYRHPSFVGLHPDKNPKECKL